MQKQKEEEMREMKVKQELEENQKIFEQQKTKIEQEIQRKIEQDQKLLEQQAKNEEEKRNFFFEETKEQKHLEEEQKSKVEKTIKGSLDSIPSPSPSVNIQIMGGKVCLRCIGRTLPPEVVKTLLKQRKMLTSPNKVCLITSSKLSHQ